VQERASLNLKRRLEAKKSRRAGTHSTGQVFQRQICVSKLGPVVLIFIAADDALARRHSAAPGAAEPVRHGALAAVLEPDASVRHAAQEADDIAPGVAPAPDASVPAAGLLASGPLAAGPLAVGPEQLAGVYIVAAVPPADGHSADTSVEIRTARYWPVLPVPAGECCYSAAP